MDWSRFFHMSLTDFRGLASRRTVVLSVMAVLLYQGTGIGYNVLKLQLIRMRPAPTATQAKAPAVEMPVREPADAYRVVTERNLFGTTTKATADKQAVSVQQDIALLVDLKGTVAGESKYGFAIIEEKGTRKQRLVKVGDVFSGAKVVRIKRNALDLLINDQVRILKMAETKEAPILPPAAAGVPTPVTAAGGPIVVNRNEVASGLQDMGSMLRQAQVRPYFNAGVPDGFMVTGIQPGSLYQKMAIAEGDIIQGVDSRSIRTADDMMMLLNTLKGASGMSLSIRRSGKQETLNYQFR
jgi:general secretion pathway protein C